jgi:hypothetical protein
MRALVNIHGTTYRMTDARHPPFLIGKTRLLYLPNSDRTEIIQNGMPNRAELERHEHREDIVHEYGEEINRAVVSDGASYTGREKQRTMCVCMCERERDIERERRLTREDERIVAR